MRKTVLKLLLFLSSAFIFTTSIQPAHALIVQSSCSGPCSLQSYCGVCTSDQNNETGVMQVYECNANTGWTYAYNERNYLCGKSQTPSTAGFCSNIQVKAHAPEGAVPEGYSYEDSLLPAIYTNSPFLQITFNILDNDSLNTFSSTVADVPITPGKNSNQLSIVASNNVSYNPLFREGEHTVVIRKQGEVGDPYCTFNYKVLPPFVSEEEKHTDRNTAFNNCSLIATPGTSSQVAVKGENYPIVIKDTLGLGLLRVTYQLHISSYITNEPIAVGNPFTPIKNEDNSNLSRIQTTINDISPGEYKLSVFYKTEAQSFKPTTPSCDTRLVIEKNGKVQETLENGEENTIPDPELKAICQSLSGNETDETSEKGKCKLCVEKGEHVFTALGCIPTNLPEFLSEYLFTIGLGFAGGIAFLLMLWGGFNILISQGDAHKIQMGREIIVSAGLGLLFIIFAIVILQFIGKDLIGIPGFGGE